MTEQEFEPGSSGLSLTPKLINHPGSSLSMESGAFSGVLLANVLCFGYMKVCLCSLKRGPTHVQNSVINFTLRRLRVQLNYVQNWDS